MKRKAFLTLGFLATLVIATGPALAANDKQFITNAIKGDISEVTLGNLAAQKGATAGVRSFGQTLVVDHDKAKQQAIAVAKELGVTPPTTMMPEAKTEYDKLSGMKGAAFDKEFVSFMVQDHQKDIADFQDQVKTGDKATAALAKKQLPVLEKHLKIAESLEAKL